MRSPFRNSPKAVSADAVTEASTTPAWPPAAALRIHPQIAYSGTPADVTAIHFPNGLTMEVTGSGDPITIDEQGLHFNNGKHLSYVPAQQVTYDGIGAFGRITIDGAAEGTLTQYPISLEGPGESLFFFRSGAKQIISDLGTVRLYAPSLKDLISDTPMTLGVYFDMDPANREYGGAHAAWLNGRIVGASIAAEPITPSKWRIGYQFQGTLHESVVFVRPQGMPGALYPPGGSSEWAMECLANA